jgi:hypothetical protein
MTTYTRRGPGQSYLKSVLSERIHSLIEHKDLNLEINPLKVSHRRSKSFAGTHTCIIVSVRHVLLERFAKGACTYLYASALPLEFST